MAKVKKAWKKPEMSEYSQKIVQTGTIGTMVPESNATAMADYIP